jgi:hypothetical protein
MSNAPTFTLAAGRTIRLDRLIIEDTYLEVEGGTPEEQRYMLLEIPYERVESLSGKGTPFFMVEPPAGDLPALTVIAQFSSEQPVRGGGSGDHSELTVCWYTDAFPADLLAHIKMVMAGINWNTHAGNFTW